MEDIHQKEIKLNQSVSTSPLEEEETLSKPGEDSLLVLSELPVSKSLKIQKLSKEDDHFLMSTDSLLHIHCPNPQTKLICANSFDSLKLYQIDSNQINFVSSHKICFPEEFHPEQLEYFSSASYPEILFLVTETAKSESNDEESEGEEDVLVFRCQYGHTKDYELQPEYLGKIKQGYSGFSDFDPLVAFELSSRFKSHERLFLIKADYESEDRGIEEKTLLATLSKHNPNVFKPVLDLTFDFQELQVYESKLDLDSSGMDEDVVDELCFDVEDEVHFFIEDFPSSKDQRFGSFCQIDEKMIIAGAIDFRSKRILTKSFLSVYEIFRQLGFTSVYHCNEMNVSSVIYSAQKDTFLVCFCVLFELLNEDDDEELEIFEDEMAKGSHKDGSPRVFMNKHDSRVKFHKLILKVNNFRDLQNRSSQFERVDPVTNFKPISENKILALVECKESIQIRVFDGEEKQRKCPKGASLYNPMIFTPKTYKSQGKLQRVFGCEEVTEIDPETVLVDTTKTLNLIDKKSGRLIDSRLYNLGLDSDPHYIQIYKDIVAAVSEEKGFIDIYQIVQGENEAISLKLIDTLDLDYLPKFVRIKKLKAIKKLEDKGILQIYLHTVVYGDNYQRRYEKKSFIAQKQLFKPKDSIEEERSNKSDQQSQELSTELEESSDSAEREKNGDSISKSDVKEEESSLSSRSSSWEIKFIDDLNVENNDRLQHGYHHGANWIEYYSRYSGVYGLTLKHLSMKEQIIKYFKVPETYLGSRKLYSCHFTEDKAYLTLGRYYYDRSGDYPEKEVVIFKIGENFNEDGWISDFDYHKSLVLDKSAEVLFDRESEKVKVLCFTKVGGAREEDEGEGEGEEESETDQEGAGQKTRTVLEIYDSELEKEVEIDLSGYEIEMNSEMKFRVIDEERVFMVVNRLSDGEFMSLVLNINDKTLTEIVDEEGKRRDSGLLGWTGERLVLVDLFGFDSETCTSDNIYFSGRI